jgi:hypothetical protein
MSSGKTCFLKHRYKHFGETCPFLIRGTLKIEAADASETLVNISLYGVTSRNTVAFKVTAVRTSNLTKGFQLLTDDHA